MINNNFRVLQLGKFYPICGGVEKVAYDLMSGLSEQNVYCDMMCAATNGESRTISVNEHAKVICCHTLAKIAATMISPAMIFALKKVQDQYDIIHVHHPDPMACLALLLSGYKGKVVLHWHSDIQKQRILLRLYSPLQKWLIRRADKIVGTSPVYLSESPFLRKVQHKTVCLPIGVDPMCPDAAGVRKIKDRYKGKKIIFSLGRLVTYKGYEFLIAATKYLKDNYMILIGGNDHFTLYNADGTVDVETALCSSRLRGNSTQNFPKLPFALKFDKKVGIQGLPTDKRWELLANWMDRTSLRNAVALDIAHRTAGAHTDGLGWSPNGVNVELVINGRHVGNYFLCEKVKIDADRVNIKDCYEDVVDGGNSNPSVADCGYLLEFDDAMDEVNCFRTDRGLPVMFKDEVPENGTLFNAIKDKIGAIEQNLENGNYSEAYKQLDINSVIDYFFVQELTFNDEYKHPKSVYMYIDGEDKLTAGPVWDFDWQTFIIPDQVRAYGGTYDCRNTDEWLYGASALAEKQWPWGNPDYVNDKPYMWYPLLFKDPTFRSSLQTRWTSVYAALQAVVAEIDRLALQNRLSDKFNSAMWPTTRTLKNECGAAFNGDEDMTFDQAIQSMKKAYTDRLNWMNAQIISGSFVTDAD